MTHPAVHSHTAPAPRSGLSAPSPNPAPPTERTFRDRKPVTAHCTIIGIDIEGFGRHHRSDTHRLRIRKGLYRTVQSAFGAAGIPWTSCRRQDLGDGILVLVPAEIPKSPFADELPTTLTEELRRHNTAHPREERMRLRLAVHAGEISYDEHGFTGASIIHTFRLLDAPELKAALAANTASLAIAGSAWFFDEVIRHSENSKATTYRRTDITTKETTTQAWIRLVPARRKSHPKTDRPAPRERETGTHCRG